MFIWCSSLIHRYLSIWYQYVITYHKISGDRISSDMLRDHKTYHNISHVSTVGDIYGAFPSLHRCLQDLLHFLFRGFQRVDLILGRHMIKAAARLVAWQFQWEKIIVYMYVHIHTIHMYVCIYIYIYTYYCDLKNNNNEISHDKPWFIMYHHGFNWNLGTLGNIDSRRSFIPV